jgi:hypothetical protein
MEQYAPTPVEEVKTVEKRFVMPTLTLVQLTLVGIIVVYAWKARKMKGAVVGSIAIAIGLLHVYDHMYRVKRGPEHLFFLPRAEQYKRRHRNKRSRSASDTTAFDAVAREAEDAMAAANKSMLSLIR